jgi:Mg2+/Co2+ transporter CorB
MFWIIVGIIIFSIIFDMFSTSALTSSEASFHAMSSQGIKGAKQTINIIKNNAKFVTICSDVIGDVCGILSGGLGAVFAINLAQTTNFNLTATVVITTAFISAFTVGGKAIFKEVAIRNSDRIIFIMGKIKYYLRMK